MFCLCTQGSCISFRGNQESVSLCYHHISFLFFHSYKMVAESLGQHLGELSRSFLPRNSQLIPSYISLVEHFHMVTPSYKIREGDGTPLQCSCLENPRDGGAWWAAVYGVAQSWTRLKRLSSSSSSYKIIWGIEY